MRKTTITARMRRDGVLVRIQSDGSEEATPIPPPQPVTSEEVERAARADPDAQPFTPAELSAVKRIPRTRTLRRALGLTQEEFAARYRIPLGTLRDWEQGRSEPDQPARAYLTVIACDPEGGARTLKNSNISTIAEPPVPSPTYLLSPKRLLRANKSAARITGSIASCALSFSATLKAKRKR